MRIIRKVFRNYCKNDFFIKWIQGCSTKTSMVNLLNKCFDPFSSFTKFSSSERNIENTMSDLYLIKKVIILKKIGNKKIKSVMVGFCSIGGWCCSGWWLWDLRILAQFQGSEISPGLLEDFMNGYIKSQDSPH